MIQKRLFLLLLIVFSVSEILVAQNGWTSLFNGKNLDGWKQLNGKAKYEVVDGMIVGTTVANTPNSFLCTEKDYGDFVLELELLVDNEMNSGIQFRSESTPDYNDGRVHGYQCEVDPSARAWSAGIYDEARRGWLYPVDENPPARAAFKHGEWNKYRIECIGNSIRTWLNGMPVSWLIDDMTPKGFIALQVHGIGSDKSKEGHQIKWRNIRIKTENLTPALDEKIQVVNLIPNNLSEPEKKQGFTLLFDGKSTDQWKSAKGDTFPEKGWEVKDGILTVLEGNHADGKNQGGDIVTKEKFGPFELKFDFMFTEGANSGVKYFTGNNGPSIGLEYQILDDDRHPDAKMGDVGNRTLASLYDLIPADKDKRVKLGPNKWNQGRLIVYPDGTVQHWLNGRKVIEYKKDSNIFKVLVARSKYAHYENFAGVERTPILLQDHNNTVHFRSIKIREL